MVRERLSDKGRRVLKELTLRRWGIGLALVVAAGITYGLMGQFRVRRVEWYGLQTLNRPTFKSSFEWMVLEKPMRQVSPRALIHHLRQHPAVRHVIVRKQWPDRVQIYIVERKPFAAVQDKEGIKVVDPEGTPFLWFQGSISNLRWKPLIVIKENFHIMKMNFRSIRVLIEVLRRDARWLLERVVWLEVRRPLTLKLGQPRVRILLPYRCQTESEEICRKWYQRRLRELQAQWPLLMERVHPRKLGEIDLRYDGYIYIRPGREKS